MSSGTIGHFSLVLNLSWWWKKVLHACCCMLVYSVPHQQFSLSLMLVGWFCLPRGRNSLLDYLVTTVSWYICESICLLIFREVEGNRRGQGSWLELRGKWFAARASPFLWWVAVDQPFPPLSCRVQWQELYCLLLNYSRQGVLFRDLMMTEENSVCGDGVGQCWVKQPWV